MTLSTVTLTWNLSNLIQVGQSATLSLVPTAQLTDITDRVNIAQLAQSVRFAGGSGSLAGIVACDNAAIFPAGWGYVITAVNAAGQVIYGPSTVFINAIAGASQDLSELTPVVAQAPMAGYLPLSGGTMAGPLITGALITGPQILADQPVIIPDAGLSDCCRVTLGGNRAMANPVNGTDAQPLLFEIIQDSAGGRTLSWGTAYEFTTAVPEPVLSVPAGQRDFAGFRYASATGLWYCVAIAQGY